MNYHWRRFILAGTTLALFWLVSLPSHAQAVYGSIRGNVTDNTGAVIPNATVTVTDVGKGTSVQVQSNATGDYTVEHLIPDFYDVKVEATGFEAFQATHIQVFADTSPQVNAKLTPGATSQTVEVSASSIPLLKTDRADVATTFTTQDVNDLPILQRNFTGIQLLLPGAQPLGWTHAADENPQGSQQIQIDGQAFGGVAYELDGTDNQDPILGIIVINPPLDAVTEAKITTQNFDAEFGKAVSSIVTAQTKSGTNSYHGSAFWYRLSNANLASNPFTQFKSTTPGVPQIPGGLRSQFGGSIGGPFLKDRLFFFGDYQGVRQRVGTSASMTVPSAYLISTCLGQTATTTGVPGCDFSQYQTALGANGIIYQQTANGPVPYPGNVIPANLLSPPALNLFRLLQPYAPNKAGNFNGLQNNYGGGGTGIFNNDQWDERVDFQWTQNIHVFERFSRFTDTLSGTTIFGAAGGAGFGINNYGGSSKGANDSLSMGMDIALNPKLLTDWRFGYYRYNITTAKFDEGTNFANTLGIPGLNVGGITSGSPGFQITDVGTSGNPSNPQSGGAQYGTALNITRCNCPLIEKEDQFQLVNNWTKLIQNHALKFGADLRYARNLRVPSDSDRTGILNFSNQPTENPALAKPGGLGFATFVLGQDTTFNRYVSVSTNAKEFQKRFFFYAQDSWRVTPKLTVNYGARYEFYFPESVNAKGFGALMQMNNYSYTDGYLRVAGYGNIPSNMGWNVAPNAWNPRVGIAYQVTPRMVVRAGYGRSFDLGVFGSIFGHVVTQNIPVLANQALTNPTITGYAFCLVPTPGCTQPAGQPAIGGPAPYVFPTVPANGLLPAPGYNTSVKARPNSLRLPTIDAWNLSIQQALTPTLTLTMAYVGNKTTHSLSAGDGNNTNPNEAAITLPAQYSITGQPTHYDPSVANGVAANGGTSNSFYLSRFYGGVLPACASPNYATPTTEFAITYPRCGWTQSISWYGDNQNAEFNALQVTLAKQFTKGFSFTTNYAWQAAYDSNPNFATWSLPAVRGRNNDLRQQQFIAYGLFELPVGKNKRFLANAPRWMDEIVGGWQLSPILNYSSGLPFTINLSSCSSWTPSSAPCYPNGKAGSLRTSVGPYNPVAHNRLFYNGNVASGTLPANFSFPTLDTIGNGGRNQKFGPHFFNTDISLQKDFPIWESLFAQFRVDFYNIFNVIQLNFANDSITAAPIDLGPQFITGMAPYGINGNGQPRQLQFSVRLQF